VALAKVRDATLCLINRERARRGLREVTSDRRLRRAATRHARDMVAKGYFAHGTFTERIAATGYPLGRNLVVGENMASGTGRLASPSTVVREWMRSAPHRRNILLRRYRAVGVGVVRGSPGRRTGASATYVADFGSFAQPAPPGPPPPPGSPPPPPPPPPPPGRGPFCAAVAWPASSALVRQLGVDTLVLGRGLVALTGC
jgi:hypothetical protein